MAVPDEISSIADGLIWSEGEADFGELFLDDVRAEIRDFHFDLRTLGSGPVPCARRADETLAPIALNGNDWRRVPGHRFYDDTVFVEPGTAQTHFHNGLTKFIWSRVLSNGDVGDRRMTLQMPSLSLSWSVWKTTSVAGFKVDVTASSNLRIHVSPTFRRNWRYFGSPTTPVHGVLVGGIYEFGADGGPYGSITPDRGTFDIPYGTVSPALTL